MTKRQLCDKITKAVNSTIDGIIDAYKHQMNESFDIDDLEHRIETSVTQKQHIDKNSKIAKDIVSEFKMKGIDISFIGNDGAEHTYFDDFDDIITIRFIRLSAPELVKDGFDNSIVISRDFDNYRVHKKWQIITPVKI